MRILHILNHTNRLNGHVHAAVDLACAQSKEGHHVLMASGGGDFDALLDRYLVKTILLSHERKPRPLLNSLRAFNAHLRQWQPDIVHAHMMTSAVLAFPICRLRSVPLVTTVHNEFEKSAILMGLGKRVIAVSQAVGDSMHRRGISASKLQVVLNGTIGSARFEGRDRSPAQLPRPNILFVGGLHPRKGVPDLLEAFRRVCETKLSVHLTIVGGGPFDEVYRRIAAETGFTKAITFIGAVEDPFPYMLGADIFVLPSHADPAPLVLSEAREAGCAIVGTQVDGIPQLLEFGKAGLLVPPRDPSALATVLADLVANPSMIEKWRDRSQYGIEKLTIERVVGETMDVYRSAISPRQRHAASAAA